VKFKGDLAQQAAEILADNLVIARAQCSRNGSSAPTTANWASAPRLAYSNEAAAADRELAPLGQALKDLDGELERSRPFLARSSTTSTPSQSGVQNAPKIASGATPTWRRRGKKQPN